MLVNLRRALRRSDDRGSTIVSVLVVVLVLSIGGLALAAIVTNTTMTLADGRSTVQSRAAADAGLADAVSALRRGGVTCGGAQHDVRVDTTDASSPTYSYRVTCTATRATITATGQAHGGMTTSQAVYEYTPNPASDGDMVFFGTNDVTFTKEVKTLAPGRLLSIVVPQATFVCQALIPGSITVGGDIEANGGCTIKGSVNAAGAVDMCCGTDVIEGDLSTSGTGSGVLRGAVLGHVHANGALVFGWEGKRVGKSVTVNGDVKLGNVRIDGTLTLPSSKTYTPQDGVVAGGVFRPATVAGPAAPILPSWFEYQYKVSDWPGYSVVTLVNAGTGAGTCDSFNSSTGNGWATLAAYTAPTVVDARACTNLSSNNGTLPVLALRTNLVILAKKFNLTTLTMKAATGLAAKPKVWFVTEDVTPTDHKPTCGTGYGPLIINGTVTDISITAMAYTPCIIDVGGNAAGIDDAWSGAFYGGGWQYGDGLTFTADPIALPGQTSASGAGGGTGVLGGLVSQRDIAPQEIP